MQPRDVEKQKASNRTRQAFDNSNRIRSGVGIISLHKQEPEYQQNYLVRSNHEKFLIKSLKCIYQIYLNTYQVLIKSLIP